MRSHEVVKTAVDTQQLPGRVANFMLHTLGVEGRLVQRRTTLLENIYRQRKNMQLIQVGSHDGSLDDPLRTFLDSHPDVNAILVEPQQAPFSRLSAHYKQRSNIKCVQRAVSADGRDLTLWRANLLGKQRSWGEALASSNPDHLRQVMKRHPFQRLAGYQVVAEEAQGITMRSLLQEAAVEPSEIDVFVCDTEGLDKVMIDQLLDTGARPSIVQFEHLHLSRAAFQESSNRLAGQGYGFDFSYKDTLASLDSN